MRLHEALKNLNVGLDTIADYLFWKGKPLKDRNLNVRLSDEQCSMIFKEFGYKPRTKSLCTAEIQEKPAVQAVLDEIHQKRGKSQSKQIAKETKANKKEKKKLKREQELIQIKGKKVHLTIKGYVNHVLYTKGYSNLFTEGRVLISDVFYNGNQLNEYWAENLLKACRTKTDFVVIDPQAKIDGSINTYARLRYNVTPEPSWLIQVKQLRPGMVLNCVVIDVDEEHYIVKRILKYNYFIWGYVSKNDYVGSYSINSTIRVRIKYIASNLFAPFVFICESSGNEFLGEEIDSSAQSKQISKDNPSADDMEFVKWRENQKKELDKQREQLQTVSGGSINISHINQDIETITCEANFFEDYEVKGKTLDEFLYVDKSISFDKYLQTTGGIVLRYKMLIALADLITAYHKAHLILGDIDPSNFEIISDDALIFKMKDDGEVSYKTNMIHMLEGKHFMAPEVKNHLSPVTPMSESYSFASLVYQMLTGEEYSVTNNFSKALFVAPHVLEMLCKSLCSDPMLRPKMSKWCDALRFGLDELVFCPHCHQWHVLGPMGSCPLCKYNSELVISLQIASYGESEIYNIERNVMEKKPTIIGNPKGDVIITEYTSKILYGYHFGTLIKKDLPIAVITVTQCNSNKDITLHIIPISGTVFTPLEENYMPRNESFEETTDVKISGDKLYRTMFLVESNTFNNKILKLCHI